MRIRLLELLPGAAAATGLTVIIDVFRACSVACYAVAAGAERILPVDSVEDALALKAAHPDYLVMHARAKVFFFPAAQTRGDPVKKLLPVWLAMAAALPGLVCSLASVHLSAPVTAIVSGGAILAASFLLLWACDVAQNDIPQALALAVVALIAVLPEYAVDMELPRLIGVNQFL